MANRARSARYLYFLIGYLCALLDEKRMIESGFLRVNRHALPASAGGETPIRLPSAAMALRNAVHGESCKRNGDSAAQKTAEAGGGSNF